MKDLNKLTLDELLTARVNATTVEQYRAVNDEISRRYNSQYVIRRIDLNVEF